MSTQQQPSTKLVDPAADQGDGYLADVRPGHRRGDMGRGDGGGGGGGDGDMGENKGETAGDWRSSTGGRKRESSILLQSDLQAAVSQTWIAPDGGWGWVVVLSALVISIIVDGLTYTFGMFFGELEAQFKEPKSTISLAGSLQVGVYLMAGPLVSALTNRFGCRRVIIAGSIITGVAFLVSSFSPNVSMLIGIYGFIGGLGFGMMYLPAIVAVSVYFEKRRAMATGIAVCGSGVGTFILAPLTKTLLNEYNWRWTLVILGGLIFNGMVCGGLMRPLEPILRPVSTMLRRSSVGEDSYRQRKVSILTVSEMGDRDRDRDRDFSKPTRLAPKATNGVKPAPEMVPLITLTDEKEATTVVLDQKKNKQEEEEEENSHQKPALLSPGNQNNKTILFSSVPNIVPSGDRQRSSSMVKKMPTHANCSSTNDLRVGWKDGRERSQTMDVIKVQEVVPKPPKENIPIGLSFIGLSDAHVNRIRDDISVRLSRRDISKSITLIAQDWSAVNQDGAFITSVRSINSLGSRKGDIGGGLWNSLKDTLAEMLDFGILKDRRYMFVLLGNFFCMIGFYVPFVYIPERAKELGISEDNAAFLISIIGIANIVGRIGTGLVVNFLKVDSLLVTTLALAVCGAVTAVCPLCESYGALIGISVMFGLGVAAYISLCSILLCELLGVKNLTNAFGFVVLFRGVASTIGPPIAGALIDATGVFHPAFYLAGGMICLSSLSHAMLLMPCFKKTNSVLEISETIDS